MRITEQRANLFKGLSFRFWEEEVQRDEITSGRDDQDQIELPADTIESHRCADESDFGGEVEDGETKRNALWTEMVGEDLRDVDVLRRVHEERPPEDEEEHEEDGCAKTGEVGGVEVFRGESAEEDQRDDAPHRAEEEVRPSPEPVDRECRPAVSNHCEAVPAGVEEERDVACEA